jgi:glycosyltransferase involved in cell wall biosynthesis
MYWYGSMDVFHLLKKGDILGERSSKDTVATIEAALPKLTVNNPLTERKSDEDKRLRVMLCGTYPIGQSNGYSRVVYYIAKHLGLKTDIALTIYGFQNYKQTMGSQLRNDIPSSVTLHDALATEDPKRHGFGEKEIASYLRKNPQDLVIIFNDMVITTALTQTIAQELTPEERKQFLLVSYMDQVYPYQKKQYIELLNNYFDAVVAFTPYWESVVRKLGLKPEIPSFHFPHGFDHTLYFPIPKKIARLFYNIPQDAFVVLNLNRNQPRKRWDHTIMAWAIVVKKYMDAQKTNPQKKLRPLKLMIATAIQGFWDLLEVYENELGKYGITLEQGKEFIITVAKPQQMSDRDINIMYNACDIGLNTCEGEGFGLCQFEHAAVGCPQVCPNIGGFKEYLHPKISSLIEPKWNYYVDKQRDGIGGYAEVGDVNDYAEAIWKYYTNPTLVQKHGSMARKEILQHYRWSTMVDHFHHVIHEIAGKRTPASL